MTNKIILLLDSNISNLKKLQGSVENYCAQHQLDHNQSYKVILVCEELFMNAVNHGEIKAKKDSIRIIVDKRNDFIKILMADRGKEFDIRNSVHRPNPINIDERYDSGVGLQIINQWADKIYYKRHNGINVTKLLRRLS